MQLSVVSTLFQSAPYIEEFYRRVRTEAEKIMPDAEFIFVNDGSTDRSLEIALELQKQDARIRVVDLSRNFGHRKAISFSSSMSILKSRPRCSAPFSSRSIEKKPTRFTASNRRGTALGSHAP